MLAVNACAKKYLTPEEVDDLKGRAIYTWADGRNLRWWKNHAHRKFDRIWKSGLMTRAQAYQYLAYLMDLDSTRAHIRLFDVDMCVRLVDLLDQLYPE